MKSPLLLITLSILLFTTFAQFEYNSCRNPYFQTTKLQPNNPCSERINPDDWTFFTYPLEGNEIEKGIRVTIEANFDLLDICSFLEGVDSENDPYDKTYPFYGAGKREIIFSRKEIRSCHGGRLILGIYNYSGLKEMLVAVEMTFDSNFFPFDIVTIFQGQIPIKDSGKTIIIAASSAAILAAIIAVCFICK